MTREEIIAKGEEQLQYTYNQMIKGNSRTITSDWANGGIDQLTMLSYILDEEYEKYDEWFNKFYPHI